MSDLSKIATPQKQLQPVYERRERRAIAIIVGLLAAVQILCVAKHTVTFTATMAVAALGIIASRELDARFGSFDTEALRSQCGPMSVVQPVATADFRWIHLVVMSQQGTSDWRLNPSRERIRDTKNTTKVYRSRHALYNAHQLSWVL